MHNRGKGLSFVLIALAVIASVALCACSSQSRSMKDALSSEPSSSIEASGSSSTKEALEDAKVSQSTTILEYSTKDTDFTTLLECDNKDAEIVAIGKLDLSKVGEQTVSYELKLGDATEKREATFTVRDTKAPVITLSQAEVSVNQGESVDAASNVSSVADPVDGALQKVEAQPEAKSSDVGLELVYDVGWYKVSGAVDTSVAGSSIITVVASDKHGNVATKDFKVNVSAVVPASAEPAPAPEAQPAPVAPVTSHYVLNTNTRKFHVNGCRSIGQMKDSNRQDIDATRDEVIAMGYSPCGICHP